MRLLCRSLCITNGRNCVQRCAASEPFSGVMILKERIVDMKVMIYSACVIIGLILATILGALGQDIAYDLNARFPAIALTTAITLVTFISIGLYIIILISLFIFNKTKKINLIVSVVPCVLIGLPVSIWSFFVWAMWMG